MSLKQYQLRRFRHHLGRLCVWLALLSQVRAAPLPGTEELDWQGDIASRLVETADRFLLDQLQQSVVQREQHWQRNNSSATVYAAFMAAQRQRLAHMLGLRDPRGPDTALQLVVDNLPPSQGDGSVRVRVGAGQGFVAYAIRWPAFADVEGEGLLLVPTGREPLANVLAIPDCELLPEQLAGLQPGVPPASQYARRLAQAGCQVVVPLLINRQRGAFDWGVRPAPDITHRELLYRSAFELGRGLIGYELQKLLAVIDGWSKSDGRRPIGLIGWGEGGLLATYAAAVDPRVDAVLVSGYFDRRESIWQEPIDRNLFGLLTQFGDAELVAMTAPRSVIIEAARGPVAELPGRGGAPARLVSPQLSVVRHEADRARRLVASFQLAEFPQLIVSGDGAGPYGSTSALQALLQALGADAHEVAAVDSIDLQPLRDERSGFDPAARHRRQMQQLDRHSQTVLRESPKLRQKFQERLDASSPEAYARTSAEYRQIFSDEVIGHFPFPLAAPRPRSRQVYQTDHWSGYEVVLDVWDHPAADHRVFAYGLLLVPNGMAPGERRPVVVCQHGLEGRPQDTVGMQGAGAYAGFAGKLAERGFITFAPQNLYIGQDRFRTLQRKSYPLQKTLFSIIVPQHQQIVDWLQTLPMVDPQRIAFYGLSYGGKTAMRVPPLVSDYCLSICSADFNEWVDKNASSSNPRSYLWTDEYEIFEFDLGSTFNYAEMAALIAPRPFMVERGHFDGVADDWTVAWEFAKVRHLYAARLGLAERCQIEWFVGPHTIHGQGSFEFLHRHLNWPAP